MFYTVYVSVSLFDIFTFHELEMACSGGGNLGGIEDFLTSLNLQEYVSLMDNEGIELDSLTELSEDDLKDIGIKKMGHRKKILKEVKRIVLRGLYNYYFTNEILVRQNF